MPSASGNPGGPASSDQISRRAVTNPPSTPAGPPPKPANDPCCLTCRARKLKCDRAKPACGRCVHQRGQCVYPEARQPSRPRKGRQNAATIGNGESSSSTSSTSPVAQNNDASGPVGILVVRQGRTHFVTNRVLASLVENIEALLKTIPDLASSEGEDILSSEFAPSSNPFGFLLNYNSISGSLHTYHPAPQTMSVLWSNYLTNVAPLVTILHRPSIKKLTEAGYDLDGLDKESEALIFAFCLVTVTSMSPGECLAQLGESRDVAIQRYRSATEQALETAALLDTQSLTLLQAYVLYLIGINGVDGTKFVWRVIAQVYRLAEELCLHLDGAHFPFNPFETEMRRRLWWTLCVMDVRSSENHGTDFQTRHGMSGPPFPLNVNDDELDPEMQTPPKARVGYTDMTFSLVRFEITAAIIKVNHGYPNNGSQLEDPGKMVETMKQNLEDKYVSHCNVQIPLQWVCATSARLLLAKLWLNVYHSMIRTDRGPKLTDEARESLFLASIEVIEFAPMVESDKRTAKWAWMFLSNTPWRAIIIALNGICVRPASFITERAWYNISIAYEILARKKGVLWDTVSPLFKAAAATRSRQQRNMQGDFGASILHPPLFDPNMQESRVCRSLPLINLPSSFKDSTTPAQPSSAVGMRLPAGFDVRPWLQNIIEDFFYLAE